MSIADHGLTDADRKFYAENGYLVIRKLVSPEEVARLRDIYDRMFASRSGRNVGDQFDLAGPDTEGQEALLPQILNPAKYHPELAVGKYRQRALAVAQFILGPTVQFMGEHAILKPAGIGAATPWHQDEAYWNPDMEYNSFSMWIPLQEATLENGCLQFLPGSHQMDVQQHQPINNDKNLHGLEVCAADVSSAVPCELNAGDCTIHHNRTLHYAGPNQSSMQRRAYVLGFGTPPIPITSGRDFYWNRMKHPPREQRAQSAKLRSGKKVNKLRSIIKTSEPVYIMASLIMMAAIVIALLTSRATRLHDAASAGPVLGAQITGHKVFPADNAWNEDISHLPVDPRSNTMIAAIGQDKPLHPDFGGLWQGALSGIPYIMVSGNQPRVPVQFEYSDQSDPGDYPIPSDIPIEGGPSGTGDRHALIIDKDNWKLYELFDLRRAGGIWHAGSGAIFDLKSDAQRPAGWTSADAAGLPIFPGLVRYDEVYNDHAISHALRFTCRKTRRAYVFPATHFASRDSNGALPPMGMRVRLKASYNISGYNAADRVILTALKKYGMILADNGSDWFVSGSADSRWRPDELNPLKKVRGSDFEVVYMTNVVADGR